MLSELQVVGSSPISSILKANFGAVAQLVEQSRFTILVVTFLKLRKTMFDRKQLETVLRLHEKSYELLKWAKSALKQGTITFSVLHTATDSVSAAMEWIQRHLANIPSTARPDASEVPLFSRLFVSFLQTSFDLSANAQVRVTTNRCCCGFCVTIQQGLNLVPRNPSKRDFKTAVELKQFYLQRLATDFQITNSGEVIANVLTDSNFKSELSMATWGAELVRRSQFASQGEAVLALWREFAWKDNNPIRDFTIKPSLILNAEQAIALRMKEFSNT